MGTLIEILLALIVAATGIDRTVDPYLTQVAETRVQEVVGTFEHRPMPELSDYWWGEVIGWNRGMTDPAASIVDGWMLSPGHAVILRDSFYPRIGCAFTVRETTWYFVCLVGRTAFDEESTSPSSRPASSGVPPGATSSAPPSPPSTGPMSDTAVAMGVDLLRQPLGVDPEP